MLTILLLHQELFLTLIPELEVVLEVQVVLVGLILAAIYLLMVVMLEFQVVHLLLHMVQVVVEVLADIQDRVELVVVLLEVVVVFGLADLVDLVEVHYQEELHLVEVLEGLDILLIVHLVLQVFQHMKVILPYIVGRR